MLSAKVSPLAVAQAKMAIENGSQESSLDDALKYEVQAIQVLAQSDDLKEGIQSFLEKRQPKFSGK